jgi:hypothetical protein
LLKFSLKKIMLQPAVVAQACNPVYSGGRDQEDYSSRSAQANKVMRQPHLNKWLDMVVYNLSF